MIWVLRNEKAASDLGTSGTRIVVGGRTDERVQLALDSFQFLDNIIKFVVSYHYIVVRRLSVSMRDCLVRICFGRDLLLDFLSILEVAESQL